MLEKKLIEEQVRQVVLNEKQLQSLYSEMQKQMLSASAKKSFDKDDIENIKNIFDMLGRDATRHIKNLDQMLSSDSTEDLAKMVM